MVIRRLFLGSGLAALGLGGGSFACNSLLGIDTASPLDAGIDASLTEADTPTDAGGPDADSASPDSASPDSGTPLESVNFQNDPCGTYCAVVKKNCPRPYLEYLETQDGGADVCMTLCAKLNNPVGHYFPFPEGEPKNPEDTLGCRLWHAHKAGEDPSLPATHCRHAGPLGSEACCATHGAAGCDPRPCEAFCNLDVPYCSEDKNRSVYNNSALYCKDVCSGDAGFPYGDLSSFGTDGGPSFDLVNENRTDWESGNTLNCRLWHLETAIATGISDHCLHTDESGGGLCVGPP